MNPANRFGNMPFKDSRAAQEGLGRSPRRLSNRLQAQADTPMSFFPLLLNLYDRILTSLQLTVDHLGQGESALQDLTVLQDQAR